MIQAEAAKRFEAEAAGVAMYLTKSVELSASSLSESAALLEMPKYLALNAVPPSETLSKTAAPAPVILQLVPEIVLPLSRILSPLVAPR